MQIVRYIGLWLFLISVGLFLSLFFMSSYTLTEEIFYREVKESHQQLLLPEMKPLFGKTYDYTISFARAIDQATEHVNTQFRDKQQWDKVIYENYTSLLTREATSGLVVERPLLLFLLIFVGGSLGALMFIVPQVELQGPPGIKNNHIFHNALNNRGWIGIVIGALLIAFYILLYFYDAYIMNWILLMRPLQELINPGGQVSQWFFYGFLYTFAIVVMGIRMLIKYRHSNYHKLRTLSLMFFQVAFAFLIPELLVRLNQPYYDFKNIWPLDYDFFYPWQLDTFLSAESTGVFMLAWGITLIVVAVPVLAFFFGKRWYCSWVCGCGGLAETAGDPFRQLSDKSLKAWQIERYMVHGVLVFAVVMTFGVLYTFFTGSNTLFGLDTYTFLRQPYGFAIGSIFAGVIGTGFYPLMGNRVWCRFGCPLAAYLGLVQRFKSRFRITTNGGQCISCGNCSTYCEMGIDVRWYAQRGQNIVRSSCVGCGVCASVCPRGVLKLENKEEDGRFGKPILIGNDSIKVVK